MSPVRIGLVALAACSSSSSPPPAPAAPVIQVGALTGDEIGTPALAVAGDDLLLAYSVRAGGRWTVPVARLRGTAWEPVGALPVGNGFAPSWADPPGLVAAGDGALVATWSEPPGPGAPAEATHIQLGRSQDGGRAWARLGVLHADRSATEHSFASLAPLPGRGGDVRAVWLDGSGVATPGGATALRGARVVGARIVDEELLDPRVCDCCATAAAATAAGPLVLYRDRGTDELRDIAVLRQDGGRWLEPARAAADGWIIDGCPVNGPALAADGDRAAAAWFTAAREWPRVRAALSSGTALGPAVDIDVPTGKRAPLGRVGVSTDGSGGAVVSWLAADGARATLFIRHLHADGRLGAPLALGETLASPQSGVPRIARRGDQVIVVWRVPGPPASLQTALVPLAAL